MKFIWHVIKLEVRLSTRNSGQWLSQLMLFVLMVTLVPFGVGSNQVVLQEVAVGFVWTALLLSTALSLPRIFEKDWENGILEQYVIAGEPIEFTIIGKTISFWLISTFPLVLISPVLCSMLYIPMDKAICLIPALATGGMSCALLGALTTSLMIGNNRAGGMLVLLTLPLFIPILIFGAIASNKAVNNELLSPEFIILLGFALLLMPISIWVQSHLVRKACE